MRGVKLKKNELMKKFNIDLNKAKFFAGHSLGEYSALAAAGYINFEDTIKILKIRGEAMQNSVQKGEGGMIAVLGTSIDVLEKIDLKHVSNLGIRNFSSGMKKRLMIGRLMLHNPEILILDEPFTGLDQNSFRWFQEYLRNFHYKGGTVLMVTHQLQIGLDLASRVLVLSKQNIKHDISQVNLTVEHCNYLLQ